MKRIIVTFFACLLCLANLMAFTGCKSNNPSDNPPTDTIEQPTPAPVDIDPSTVDKVVERWNVAELSFESANDYASIRNTVLYDCEMNAVFTAPDGTEYTVPAFWDGKNVWRVRFAPNQCGVWTYKTTCATDEGLNEKTGKIGCNAYKGDLDIYKHGFVKTEANTPYFMYDDGTPFFYLGDTHWGMSNEEFDSAGPYAGNLNTDSHFKYIVDKRVEQKFTVYQSEPIDVKFDFSNGFSKSDISGLQTYDKYIQYIAEKGLVHANAMLFWSNKMYYNAPAVYKDGTYDYEYLEKISRYWVARYSAYPMLWTMAQEVDDDFYYSRGSQSYFDAETNPWKRVAAFTYKYDPYKHPLTAHMEAAGSTAGTTVTTSSFRNIEGHSWFAIQTGVQLQANFNLVKDFWKDSQGKVLVMYEGRYENLWTANYGALAQGWYAYLNGMFGYGYGAQDMWNYNSEYGTDVPTSDGFDEITIEEKKVKWSEAIEFQTGYQLTYMRAFFESFDWWKLRPDFDNNEKFKFSRDTLWACAADGTDTYVAYLYKKTKLAGQMLNMDNEATYTIKWFNPRTNEYTEIGNDITPVDGVYSMPSKPSSTDWVIIATKNK